MEKELALYLHFPFCKRKCYYCDFYSVGDQEHLIPDYVAALTDEMVTFLPERRYISSVYFGGGTPSLLSPEILAKLLLFIKTHFLVSANTEITLEVNPATLGVDGLIQLKEAGFNRLSIGLQAVQDRLLETIGRIHNWEEFYNLFELARETGYTNLGVDLIFGLPGQTISEWRATLEQVTDLNPEHISAYALQLEEGTPLKEMAETGRVRLPCEDDLVAMMRLAMSYLPEHGYDHYEISNYAKPGYHSVHNLGYWSGREYLGFGSGAYSTSHGERRANISNLVEYIELIKNGNNPVVSREMIDQEKAAVEGLMLGLRLRKGVNLKKFERQFGIDLLNKGAAVLERFKTENLVTVKEDRLALTDSGILVSNQIISSLMAAI